MASDHEVGFAELQAQLRMTNALLALHLQKAHKLPQSELISVLSAAEAPAGEIAKVLGSTTNSVQVTMSRQRKKRKT